MKGLMDTNFHGVVLFHVITTNMKKALFYDQYKLYT